MKFESAKLAKLAGNTRPGSPAESYKAPVAPVSVYLLADHLDRALAAGEDLLSQSFTWHAADLRAADNAARERSDNRQAFQSIRTLELTLMSRLMRAREHAEALARKDQRFKLVARLFVSGTMPLADAVADLSDKTNHDFETGDAVMAYLRGRGLVEADVAAPSEGAKIAIPEAFLVARRIPLGVLLDLVAMFLDTLETHYDLFVEDVVDTQDERDDPCPLDEAATRSATVRS